MASLSCCALPVRLLVLLQRHAGVFLPGRLPRFLRWGPCCACRMLQLLHERRVKRLILLSDGRTAIVEVPVENTESDFDTVTYNRRDLRCALPRCCC